MQGGLWLFAVLAALGGAAVSTQAGVNSVFADRAGGIPWAAAFSAGVTSLLLAGYASLIGRTPLPTPSRFADMPWWGWTGGLLGAAFLLAATAAAPRIGAAAMIACAIAGQLTAAVLLDHFGVAGFAERRLDPTRALGVVLLACGVLLVLRR